ncbi:porin [Burkholderia dolosa]|uniref:Porin n=1 Tax=Burkholderia dolosa TaxID=152500 RepID=A0A892IEL6_9BURK|nr:MULTISPECIES: porin [Burkholderia]AKE01995.1 porin [Burkholderia cepacia]AJY11063.1 gram-negative porin family protein [Burkholderia dolosa AU0158]AYZ95580.1 porin [Burkholderia dolosa]EAY72043.1 Outer membrane protein (porin) [Burkholderia dolosa AU0158]MBR8418027.1 porin [Burkholderia dolosa]
MKQTQPIAARARMRNVVRTLGVTATLGAGLASTFVDARAAGGAEVQLYGIVGTYVGSVKRSDTPQAAALMGSGGLTTSFWGIRGKEDLGGGVSAIFALESFFQPQNGALGRNATDPFWSRNAYLGFQGDFGRLTFGRHRNPTYTAESLVNPFGSSTVFSPLVLQTFVTNYGGTMIGDTVWNNTAQYTTPNVRGFGATVIYGLGGVAGSPGIGNLGVHFSYQGHGLTAVLSGQRVRYTAAGPVGAQYAYLAGAAYDFKVATLYAAWAMTSDVSTPTGSHTYEAGLSIPFSPADFLLAEWARTKRSGPRPANNSLRNTVSFGYDHFLSKRTDIYAIYSYDKLTARATGNTFAVGVRHTF